MATPRLSRVAALGGLVAVGLMAGCAGDLPLQERIASTRPLALRVEVIDPAADPALAVRTEALPLEQIEIIPLVADPSGIVDDDAVVADIDPVWLACPLQPIQGVFGCLSGRLPLQLDAIEDCPTFDLASLDPNDPVFPEVPVPCRITGGTAARPQLQVPIHPNLLIGGDLEITMIGHLPGESSTAACSEAVLGGTEGIPASCLVLSHRAPVGPDAQILQLAEAFGIEGLGETAVAPPEVPDADRNPRIETFTVAVMDEDQVIDTVQVARGDVLTVAAGATLEIVTTAPREDLQTYFIPQDEGQFERTQEFYDGSWFRTWGDLLSPVSDDPMSMNTWTMVPGEQDEDDELPPDGRATLVYVLRDSRSGVDWWWFSVDVTAR
jgi:hypothetical protein